MEEWVARTTVGLGASLTMIVIGVLGLTEYLPNEKFILIVLLLLCVVLAFLLGWQSMCLGQR